MRKLFYVALIGLLALLVMPGVVSAAESDTVTVSGTIGGYIDVAVAADTLSLGTMTIAGPNTAATSLTVSSSFNSWGVDVSANNAGYMADATPDPDVPLDTLFDISNDAGATWHQLGTTWTDFFTGTAGTGMTETVNVRQIVTVGDPAGTYSITVTFTGASN
jgi:hypothetical protein